MANAMEYVNPGGVFMTPFTGENSMNIQKTLGILCASALYLGAPLAQANSTDVNPSTTTSQTADPPGTTAHHHHKSKTNGTNTNSSKQNAAPNGTSNMDSAGMTVNRPSRSQ
jgi:hypothetical protein